MGMRLRVPLLLAVKRKRKIFEVNNKSICIYKKNFFKKYNHL